MANVGAAWGQPVAMVAQVVHYASMAQVVKVSPQASSLMEDTKKLRSIVISQVLVVHQHGWQTTTVNVKVEPGSS